MPVAMEREIRIEAFSIAELRKGKSILQLRL